MGKKRQREREAEIREATNEQLAEAKEMMQAQQVRVDEQKQAYREFEFENPFAGMENPFEDLTVSQEAARFQAEQAAQQRANILAGLQGAAGASGIAGLAQSLANQGTIQARQASADIARQEAANRQAAAQGQLRTDMLIRQGEAAVQSAEFGRESTLYAAELGELAGTRQMRGQALGNQMSGFATMQQMEAARLGAISGFAGGVGDLLTADASSVAGKILGI